MLFFAAGNDIMAIKLHLSINDITQLLRIGIFVLPPLAFWVTKRICLQPAAPRPRQGAARSRERHDHPHRRGPVLREARAARRVRALDPGPAAGRRSPSRSARRPTPTGSPPRRARSERLRAKLSHFYFKDRVAPVTPAELAAAHHHGEHEASSPPETSGSLEGPPETQGLGLPVSEREAVKRAPEKDL